MTTMGAGRTRGDQIKGFVITCHVSFEFKVFTAFLVPLPFQHDGQAVDYDIQEAANQQAQDQGGDIQCQWIRRKKFDIGKHELS